MDPLTSKRGGRSSTGQSARLWPGYVPVRARPVSLGLGAAPILHPRVRSSGEKSDALRRRARWFDSTRTRSGEVPLIATNGTVAEAGRRAALRLRCP